MNIPLFVILIFLLQGACFVVGLISARRERGKAGYFLVSRKMGFVPLTMTLIATLIGGGSTLGAAEEAYRHGWIIILYPLGGSLGFILLASGLSTRLNRYKVSTIAQIMGVAYKSDTLKKVASLLSMIALMAILVGQIIAARKFMHTLGVTSEVLFLGFWAIVILYTAWGGLRAVASTDVLQGLFFIIVFGFCATQVPTENQPHEYIYDFNKFCNWLLMPMLFMIIEQDVGQRSFAAVSQKTFSAAAITAAVVSLLISLVPISFGLLATEVPLGSSVLITAIMQLNPIMGAFAGCAILAAIVSTADSEINAISSNLSQDFTAKLPLSTVKGLTIALSCVAFFLSYLFHNIIDVIIVSFELSVYCLFVPIIMALYRTKLPKRAAIVSMIAGGVTFFILKLTGFEAIPHPIVALGASLAGFLVVKTT